MKIFMEFKDGSWTFHVQFFIFGCSGEEMNSYEEKAFVNIQVRNKREVERLVVNKKHGKAVCVVTARE